ncbi:bifunctional diguanylate cyclase/phosphodiesterase [Novosphingobium sp. AP12]|uniref:putative bifunctional diguanylate cyclase/phosphodiesterase n=1 Tax=Novosphingobium sp. AP12 TaxID=1144305 RepID=UPI00027214A3|nr:GGDEF domain-containing protein [Novosphingobium sp. AP12]EJL32312.1 diguanylate cyclase (GGDEF) domain-containing protein [Novosphingobium sp. AP12]
MTQLQNIILEMIARGEPLADTVGRLCQEVESLVPGAICSVLGVDAAGHLRSLAAPSLPAQYCDAIDGLAIGPGVGACGTAAYLGREVVSSDVATDPLWDDFRHLVLALGLQACWSSPVLDSEGRVIATFAFYYQEKRGPSALERDIVAQCVNLCTIAFDRERRVTEYERRANTDGLTGLPNRAAFETELAGLSCAVPGAWALCMIDLDNLKVANDTFGHAAGDALLRQVGMRLGTAAAPDRVFRLGGDEFAVVMTSGAALADPDAAAGRYLDVLVPPLEGDDWVIVPRATLGFAVLSPGDCTSQRVRQNADFALYHAKETARGSAVRYWPGIGTRMTRRLTAIREVDAALREGRMEAHYQPIFKLETGEIIGLEALSRMRLGASLVPASSFYEATTDASVAGALTERMIAQVARDLRGWLDMGIPFQHVGINVSSTDFRKGNLFAVLSQAFGEAGVPLGHVVLEVTESVYMDDDAGFVRDAIAGLRASGLKIALDDFGTGFASLTHLLTVPVDIIKIDKSFVDGVGAAGASDVIVGGLMRIAAELGVKVVAEGIETAVQVAGLRSLGCNLGQGFFFSKAISAREAGVMMLGRAQGLAAGADWPGRARA